MKKEFFAATLAALFMASAAAQASPSAKAPVDVRVVTWKGEILADGALVAQTTSVPTSSKALCFGGTPTDGFRRLPGTTALGALQRATQGIRDLRPLLLTNAFDFGLGVCAVGKFAPAGEEWWALTVNGALATTGGDTTLLKAGDEVLWYMDRSYSQPMPDELRLIAPRVVRKGASATVRVLAYDATGKSRPAEGVRVFVGADIAGTTDTSGRIRVRIDSTRRLVARIAGSIPSNREVVEALAPKRRQARR